MELEIHSVADKGNLENERLWLQVTADIADLMYFAASDTTYTDAGNVSNELRHIYWFPPGWQATKGDWICLYSKNGTNSKSTNDKNTTTHTLYWNLGRTLWNTGKDQAIVFKLSTWMTKAV
jgi:hypothetical protein